jgi:hypothetical protein
MSTNNLNRLNNILFAQLDRLNRASGSTLNLERERSKEIIRIAEMIITGAVIDCHMPVHKNPVPFTVVGNEQLRFV